MQFGTLFKLALRFGEEMERSCDGAENFYNFFFSYCSQGIRESPWSFLSVPRSQADA
jgi:hypothetical protein